MENGTAVSLVVLLAAVFAGCTATLETEDLASPVVGGRSEDGYPAVGYLLAGADAGSLGRVCGATAIRPKVAVTAAHCVVGSRAFGIGFVDGGDEHVARAAITHPDYDPNGFERYRHDVAVILFDDDLRVEPAVVAQTQPGDAGRYIGFGRTTPGGQDVADGYTFERKSAAQTVEREAGRSIWTTGVDGGLCWGDSGGPLMIDGTSTILGVLADFDGVFDCHVGNRMIFTSLAGEEDFLEAAIEGRIDGVGGGGGGPGEVGGGNAGWGGAGCQYDCATHGYAEGDCADGWRGSDGCIVYDGCGPGPGSANGACELGCSDFGYSAGECFGGWYCDGACLTFTGCWIDDGGASCEYTCAEYGYAAGECEDGWYCDGVCLSYAGCGFGDDAGGDGGGGWGDGWDEE